ncbi:hypothetical protein D6825_01060 [Candidatus Woesearchaeota archaeon]|nr:MAG: hypothetical protein D6825_01060 [Candidatus Woesearchaeota archaeon]
MRRVLILLALALLIACAQEEGKQVNIEQSPFVGGTQGVELSFQDVRESVFDSGTDPFDVIVKLENKGESPVEKATARVELSGINPAEFGKTPQELIQNPPDDLVETRKDPQGNIIPGSPVFVEFRGLNYQKALAGAQAQFTLRAESCYLYRTRAVSKLCVRKNLLSPRPGGICSVSEAKQVHNSGSPVHIQNLKQTTRSGNKIGFSFEVANIGSGELYERNSNCDKTNRKSSNRAYLIVNTGLSGLQCTGLNPVQDGAEGWITLYGGRKQISCTQTISNPADYEQLINIEAIYDYSQSAQTNIIVKSSE